MGARYFLLAPPYVAEFRRHPELFVSHMKERSTNTRLKGEEKMKSKLLLGIIPVMLILTLAIVPVLASPPMQPTSKPFQLTTNPRYDRNPSFFQASDGTYWLFFTRGRNPIGIRGASYNPDYDSYDIYYKTARSIPQLAKAIENLVPGSNLVTYNTQRDIAALQASDGTIWAFTSSGYGPSSDAHIFYYKYDGASWSSPTAIPNTDDAGHIDALEYDGKIWVFFDAWSYILQVTSYDEETTLWSTPQIIHYDATLAKGIIDSGKFYLVWASMSGGAGTGIYLSNSTDGTTWTSTSTPIAQWGAGLTNYDPVLIKDRDTFRLFWAPSNSEQFIATSTSTNPTDPSSWSTPVRVTTASYGSIGWWDFWPEPFKKGSTYLFYTSERSSDGTAMIDGNIWVYMAVPLTS